MRFCLSVFLVIFVMFLASCSDREVARQQLLLKGNQALEIQNYEQAIRYYSEADKLDSCFADARNNLGTVYFRTRQWDKAIQWYDQALACEVRAEFLFNRANSHLENQAFFLALEDADKVLKVRPDTVPALALKALVYLRMRMYDEAITLYDRILTLESNQPDWWVNRATLAYYLADFNRALADVTNALRLKADHPEAMNTKAMILSETGRADSALIWIDRAIALDANHPHFINNRGFIRMLLNRDAEAEYDINEGITRDPDNPWAYRNRGILYFRRGDFRDAERLFRQSLKMDSSVEHAAGYLGLSLLRQGRASEACVWMAREHRVPPGLNANEFNCR